MLILPDLVVAVNIGVILATLHFMRRMASSVEVQNVTHQELHQEFAHRGFQQLPPGVLVYSIDGPFFFGAAENFERALASTRTDPRVLIVRLGWVPFIDETGLQTLEEVVTDLRRRGITSTGSPRTGAQGPQGRCAPVLPLMRQVAIMEIEDIDDGVPYGRLKEAVAMLSPFVRAVMAGIGEGQRLNSQIRECGFAGVAVEAGPGPVMRPELKYLLAQARRASPNVLVHNAKLPPEVEDRLPGMGVTHLSGRALATAD